MNEHNILFWKTNFYSSVPAIDAKQFMLLLGKIPEADSFKFELIKQNLKKVLMNLNYFNS